MNTFHLQQGKETHFPTNVSSTLTAKAKEEKHRIQTETSLHTQLQATLNSLKKENAPKDILFFL